MAEETTSGERETVRQWGRGCGMKIGLGLAILAFELLNEFLSSAYTKL